MIWFQLLKCEYFLISFLHYDSELIIFGLWTKQDILGDVLGFGTDTDQHFLTLSDIL